MKTLIKEITLNNEEEIPFPILSNGSGWKSTEQENLSVIESGDQKVLLSKMINAIDNAEELICVQSFLFQDTALVDSLLNAVVQRKVQVFILSSVEARLKDTIEEEQDFIKESFIQLLESKFKGHFIHRSAQNFHAKYILIDPTLKPKGFLCTNNLTDYGFTKNPELAIELNKEECEELFKIFVYHFWEHSSDEQTATKEFDKVKPVNKFSLPILQKVLLTSPNNDYNSLCTALVSAINGAERAISFSTFLIDKNSEVTLAILDKAKHGLEVTIFCRPIEWLFNEQLRDFLEAGARIYFHQLTHAKSLLVDGKVGFIFTANLTGKGLEQGLEVGINLNEQQTFDLARIHESWRDNFPFKAIKAAFVKELNEVWSFREGKLTKVVMEDEKKDERKRVIQVSDLFSFFNRKPEIKSNTTRSVKWNLIAEIADLPGNIKADGNDLFEIVEVEEEKGIISKLVVIKNDFAADDIVKLDQWKDLRIFYR